MRIVAAVCVLILSACGSVDSKKPDAGGADACVPETDTQFCSRMSNACEMHSGMDNCGTPRNADCGACASGQGCVVGQCKTPVCSSFNYTSTNLAAFTQAGIEDSIGGATPDARVILYVKTVGGTCQAYHLMVADEMTPGSGTYNQQDASNAFIALGLFVGQEGYAISPDGLTIYTHTTDAKRFVSTKRSALNMIDFAAPSTADFDQINAFVTTDGKLRAPVISVDGLQFIFQVHSATDTTKNGIYESLRTSTSMPFPTPTKMPAPVNNYPFATGISSDRLTLFVFDNFQGRALVRLSTSAPFVNANAPAAPPAIAGWSHKPLTDCAKLIAMTSPGGCANEDVIQLTRQ
jgi:hypothetical protein